MVLTKERNFLLTHFDFPISKFKELKQIFESNDFLSYDFAPEFFENQSYTFQSNIWDLGILIFQILNDLKNPNINYERK